MLIFTGELIVRWTRWRRHALADGINDIIIIWSTVVRAICRDRGSRPTAPIRGVPVIYPRRWIITRCRLRKRAHGGKPAQCGYHRLIIIIGNSVKMMTLTWVWWTGWATTGWTAVRSGRWRWARRPRRRRRSANYWTTGTRTAATTATIWPVRSCSWTSCSWSDSTRRRPHRRTSTSAACASAARFLAARPRATGSTRTVQTTTAPARPAGAGSRRRRLSCTPPWPRRPPAAFSSCNWRPRRRPRRPAVLLLLHRRSSSVPRPHDDTFILFLLLLLLLCVLLPLDVLQAKVHVTISGNRVILSWAWGMDMRFNTSDLIVKTPFQ